MENKTFNDSLKQGAIGEHYIWNLLRKMPNVIQIIDVTEYEQWQKDDVDFLVEFYDTEKKRKFIKYVEIKTDFKAHETGNIAYEISTSGNMGCFYKTKADYVFYFLPISHTAHMIDVKRMNDYVDTYPQKSYKMGDNAEGFLLKISELKSKGVIVRSWENVE